MFKALHVGQDWRKLVGTVADVFQAYTASIIRSVNGSETNDTTLASASSNFNFTPSSPGYAGRGDVVIKILGGADSSSALPDGTVNWNFEDFTWQSGTTFAPGEMDLISAAMHELLHAVGFDHA